MHRIADLRQIVNIRQNMEFFEHMIYTVLIVHALSSLMALFAVVGIPEHNGFGGAGLADRRFIHPIGQHPVFFFRLQLAILQTLNAEEHFSITRLTRTTTSGFSTIRVRSSFIWNTASFSLPTPSDPGYWGNCPPGYNRPS